MMIRLLLMSVFCFAIANNAVANNAVLKSGVFEPPRMAPDFSLASSRDNVFTLSEQRGKLVVLGFGFSYCPNVCPMTLANLAQTAKHLGALADQVQVVYVTVDPERDTADRLREYLANFNPNFIGVTGSVDELAAVRQAYGIIAKKEVHKNGGTYEVHHSSYLYLIDREGLLRALVPFGKSADDIAHDIKLLLQDKNQQAAL
ncbi:SCO family protein [Cellvibrio sp. UBA7661]|uniref:SCO family protein n=1 Tax=Cellvibrio sp. UBA7661 TaxID=1946311 RepID=UPI002F352287